ncbi:hypothetical protein HZC35_00670 [Candidatus Saganbacteria bacterium]|nr:hypothetical protein [Candidatus Saganbacteria bacterium]
MKVLIGKGQSDRSGLQEVCRFRTGESLCLDAKNAQFILELSAGVKIYLFGEVFYHIKRNGSIKLIGEAGGAYLRRLFLENELTEIIPTLEGQYVGVLVDQSSGKVKFFSDRYARLDCFYAADRDGFYLSTELDFIFQWIKAEYDQLMLANFFSVYGYYAPKGMTIYSNVKELRVGEALTLRGLTASSETLPFKPLPIEEYGDKDLETYYKLLRESIVARANKKGKVWVSSSSGWDSSTILGVLVNELGSKNVGMITTSVQYSKATKVINQFETDKVRKIGKFYGIKPELVDLDYSKKGPALYDGKLLNHFRSRHIYSFSAYNAMGLSGRLKQLGTPEGMIVFNGETSDSFHNFGFSQFATFFHSQKPFTEYADKMNCYLYGPSFLKKVLDGSYNKDKVFQIFRAMVGAVEFASGFKTRKELLNAWLMPLFYGSPRIPFAQTINNPLLNEKGRRKIYDYPFGEYLPEALENLSEKNVYAWLIYLYHSFHSQGSTVNAPKHALEFNGHRWRMPYNDYRLIGFLSKAPESWGRGLDLNHTKYPLKWVARNKLKFPYEILDEGPHSYLYDVIEGVSLGAELCYRSGCTPLFKEVLSRREYRRILTDRYFDLKYLDKLVSDYLEGREARGGDFNNLVSLIVLSVTGWY